MWKDRDLQQQSEITFPRRKWVFRFAQIEQQISNKIEWPNLSENMLFIYKEKLKKMNCKYWNDGLCCRILCSRLHFHLSVISFSFFYLIIHIFVKNFRCSKTGNTKTECEHTAFPSSINMIKDITWLNSSSAYHQALHNFSNWFWKLTIVDDTKKRLQKKNKLLISLSKSHPCMNAVDFPRQI